ncbi:MAG: sigma-70 family RNA polymerase sigma factor [Candidatus Micrarchaeia archaeon]
MTEKAKSDFQKALERLKADHERIVLSKAAAPQKIVPTDGEFFHDDRKGKTPEWARTPLTKEQRALVAEHDKLAYGALKEMRNGRAKWNHPLFGEYWRDLNKRDDLVQVAKLGLIAAIKTYDPSRETKISTHAYPRIWGEVVHYLKKEQSQKRPSLDEPVNSSEGEIGSRKDLVEARESWDAFTLKASEGALRKIHEHANSERNFRIYVLRSGFGHTLDGIAKVFGVSNTAIRQINNRVHRRLPEELRLQSQAKTHNAKRRH